MRGPILIAVAAALAVGGDYIQEDTASSSVVDWTHGTIVTTGRGTAATNSRALSEDLAGVRDAARRDAEEKLLRGVASIRVDGKRFVRDYLAKPGPVHDALRAFMRGMQKTSRIRYSSSGRYVEVEYALPLYGAASLYGALGIQVGYQGFPEELIGPEGDETASYTGLLVDARTDLEAIREEYPARLQPALCPRVFTRPPSGEEVIVFSSSVVGRSPVDRQGLVRYHVDPEQAMADPRLGERPLITGALEFRGNRSSGFVDVLIDYDDARRLLANKRTRAAIEGCAVVFLIDPPPTR